MQANLHGRRWRSLISKLALSRHSALGSASARSIGKPSSLAAQVVWLIVGSSLIGVAVALLVEAQFGLAPYDVFSSGLSGEIGVSLGQAGWVVAAFLFAAAAVLGRPPSPWGIAYILLNGVAVDAASIILRTPESLPLRIAFLIAGIVTMAVGINVVVHSGTTGGPFELLMAAGADRGVSPIKVRYGLDITVFALGLLLGGTAGAGTIIYAATMGICLSTIGEAIEDYKLGRSVRRGATFAVEGRSDLGMDSRQMSELDSSIMSNLQMSQHQDSNV